MSEQIHLTPAEKLHKQYVHKHGIPWPWILPVLCAVFALVCWGYCQRTTREEVQAVQTKTTASAFENLIPDGLGTPVRAVVRQNVESYTLKANGDGYVLEDSSMEIDAAKAKALLSCGASILSRDSMDGNAEDFGVNAESLNVEFTYENGQSLRLTFGSAPANGQGRYAMVDGSEKVYVVNSSLYETLSAGKYALLAMPDLSEYFTAQTLMEVTIRRPGRDAITIRRVTEENPFNNVAEFTAPIHYPANSERTATLFLALADIAPAQILDWTSENAAYGLDAPLAELILTGSTGKALYLTIGENESGLTMRINGEEAVYALEEGMADFLDTATVSYLAEQLPGLVAVSEVDSIALVRDGEQHEMVIDRTNGETSYSLDGARQDEESFLAIYREIIGLLIDRYSPQALPTEPVEASFEYHLTDGTVWTLAFAEYDDEYYAVVREGEANFLIARSKVEAVFMHLATPSGDTE